MFSGIETKGRKVLTSKSTAGRSGSSAADGGEGRTGPEMGVSWSVGGPGFSSERPVSSGLNNMASSLETVGCDLTQGETRSV